jgi:formin 2
MSTLLTFVTMFRKAHEENVKQADLEKKKAQKEAAEAEKSKSAQLASKNVLILDYTCFSVTQPQEFLYVCVLICS